jgi:CDP-6-deoxy-D-xylo-4-hexulose-3-dehydrase
MQAAIGCAQLEKFQSFVEKRRSNWQRLYDGLKDLQDKLILPEAAHNSKPSWFGFMLTCKKGISRNQLVQHLESNNIQTRMLFAGNLVKHPCFDEMRKTVTGYRVAGTLENTDRIMNDTFWIGIYPGMSDTMIDKMIEVVKKGIKNRGKYDINIPPPPPPPLNPP